MHRHFDAVIIGAGLSGLYALHKLRSHGFSCRSFDEAADVGGTWWWNRYPGARVDSPGAPFYGYTFSDDLAREWDWRETQPDQPAILQYLNHVADRFDLRRDIQFGTRVETAVWSTADLCWRLTTSNQEVISATFLISAVGTLSASFLPGIPGATTFRGETIHTGHWPAEGVPLQNKRVGVIGTGSSGVQVIPFIAKEAEDVYIFQRTPQYVIPGRNRPLEPERASEIRSNWSEYRDRIHSTGRPYPGPAKKAVEVPEAERLQTYEEAWNRGGLAFALTFADHMTDAAANSHIAQFVRSKIHAMVDDPETARKLEPHFLFGGKRLILGEGYYETFNRSNVHLVDLRENPIESITPTGVRTKEGRYDVDVLVYATGYDALTGAILRLNPTGADGSLKSHWENGVRTYLGIGVHGFPNLMMIHGPQSPSVKFHMGLGAERQVDWICRLIEWMRARSLSTVHPDSGEEILWADEVRRLADRTLFPRTDSWFSGANIPGKPREFMIHVDGPRYHKQLLDVEAQGYRGFSFTSG